MPRFYPKGFVRGNPRPKFLGHCVTIDSLASLQRLRVTFLPGIMHGICHRLTSNNQFMPGCIVVSQVNLSMARWERRAGYIMAGSASLTRPTTARLATDR